MRVARRLAELGGDVLEQVVGDGVLELLGLVVHLVPAHAELLDEQRLEQAVATHHGAAQAAGPASGQAHAAVAHVLDETVAGETLHHLGHRGRRHRETLGELAGGDGLAGLRLQKVDRLQVVLDCRGCERCSRDGLAHGFVVAMLGSPQTSEEGHLMLDRPRDRPAQSRRFAPDAERPWLSFPLCRQRRGIVSSQQVGLCRSAPAVC